MLDPDHDLVQAVMSISKKHRIRLNIIFHVKSHQDDDVVAYGQLSCLGSNKAKRQLWSVVATLTQCPKCRQIATEQKPTASSYAMGRLYW